MSRFSFTPGQVFVFMNGRSKGKTEEARRHVRANGKRATIYASTPSGRLVGTEWGVDGNPVIDVEAKLVISRQPVKPRRPSRRPIA